MRLIIVSMRFPLCLEPGERRLMPGSVRSMSGLITTALIRLRRGIPFPGTLPTHQAGSLWRGIKRLAPLRLRFCLLRLVCREKISLLHGCSFPYDAWQFLPGAFRAGVGRVAPRAPRPPAACRMDSIWAAGRDSAIRAALAGSGDR